MNSESWSIVERKRKNKQPKPKRINNLIINRVCQDDHCIDEIQECEIAPCGRWFCHKCIKREHGNGYKCECGIVKCRCDLGHKTTIFDKVGLCKKCEIRKENLKKAAKKRIYIKDNNEGDGKL